MNFYAQSSGTAGQHGLAFSDTVNSTVIGVALVAAPVLADPTQDVLITRGYFTTAQQKVKTSGYQVGVGWDVAFLPGP